MGLAFSFLLFLFHAAIIVKRNSTQSRNRHRFDWHLLFQFVIPFLLQFRLPLFSPAFIFNPALLSRSFTSLLASYRLARQSKSSTSSHFVFIFPNYLLKLRQPFNCGNLLPSILLNLLTPLIFTFCLPTARGCPILGQNVFSNRPFVALEQAAPSAETSIKGGKHI